MPTIVIYIIGGCLGLITGIPIGLAMAPRKSHVRLQIEPDHVAYQRGRAEATQGFRAAMENAN